jgi:PAS domain S-box-containing protein
MIKDTSAARYSLAIAVTIFALLLRRVLTPIMGAENPYHTVWLAVVFAAWLCGFGPSIVAMSLSAVGVWFWLLRPPHSFRYHDRTQVFGLLGFLLLSSVIIAFGESNRRRGVVQARMAAIVESSDDAIVSKTLAGIITSWNKGAERVFGYTPSEAIGQHISLVIPLDRWQEEEVILESVRRGLRVDHFETFRIRKDGKIIDTSLTVSPVRDLSGRVIGASKVARDITDQKRAQEVLMEREISVRLLRLQDEERRRIARELHDGVGQLVVAIAMNASILESEKSALSPLAAKALDDNSKLIQQASKDVRTVSYLLHPPLLDEIGLASALQWYLDGFAERSKMVAKLEVTPEIKRLAPDHELCLFRVAQECLTNIHRHSGSSAVHLKLTQEMGVAKLTVADEGTGINPDIYSKVQSGRGVGMGLRGMRERLRSLGGTLEIESSENGTSVVASLPTE